jgi:hypothetical protein
MMLTAAPSRGCRYRPHRLCALLRPGSSRVPNQHGSVLHYALIRYVHGEQLPHDTRTEGIRNIGIIAHVDAVRLPSTLAVAWH